MYAFFTFFFLLFFSLFASNWVISKSPSSGSLILASTWSTPMQIPLIFYLIHWIFSSRMFVSFFFIVFISLLNFSFCSCIFFLILLTCLLCFLRAHCFLRTAILNSLSSRLQDFAFLSSVIWRIITFLRWLFFLIFYVPWVFALLICLWWSRHLLKSLIVAFKWGTVRSFELREGRNRVDPCLRPHCTPTGPHKCLWHWIEFKEEASVWELEFWDLGRYKKLVLLHLLGDVSLFWPPWAHILPSTSPSHRHGHRPLRACLLTHLMLSVSPQYWV